MILVSEAGTSTDSTIAAYKSFNWVSPILPKPCLVA